MSDDSEDYDYRETGDYDNSPAKVYANEYTSILNSLFQHIVHPVANNLPINRLLLLDVNSELDFKIGKKNFNDLPFKIKDAYNRLRRFTEILDKSDDEEIRWQSEALEGLYHLSQKCFYSEDEVAYAGGRNLCRDKQYKAKSLIHKVEESLGETELVYAAKNILDICRLCPHK